MKYLLLLLMSANAFACVVSLDQDAARSVIDGAKWSDYKKCIGESCVCLDSVEPEVAKLVTDKDGNVSAVMDEAKKSARDAAIKKSLDDSASALSSAKAAVKNAVSASAKIQALIDYLKLRDGI